MRYRVWLVSGEAVARGRAGRGWGGGRSAREGEGIRVRPALERTSITSHHLQAAQLCTPALQSTEDGLRGAALSRQGWAQGWAQGRAQGGVTGGLDNKSALPRP